MIHCCYAVIDEKETFEKINNVNDNTHKRGFYQETLGDNIQNAEFNLQTRGPDGIVYGCFVPKDEIQDFLPQLYLIDALGVRIVNSSNIAVASKFKYY